MYEEWSLYIYLFNYALIHFKGFVDFDTVAYYDERLFEVAMLTVSFGSRITAVASYIEQVCRNSNLFTIFHYHSGYYSLIVINFI